MKALSPNQGERRGGKRPDALILHYTGMDSAEAALARLCDPQSQVSAHYVVEETGRIIQLVPEERRAWHAGVSCWQGERDMNSCSIGIEIVNGGHEAGLPPYPEAQIVALMALCQDLVAHWRIPPARVLGHSDIAPSRKRDPGEHFPWARLAQAGVGLWVEDGEVEEADGDVKSLLRLYGYDVESGTRAAVAAFQRHFLPQRVDGVADARMLAVLLCMLQKAL